MEKNTEKYFLNAVERNALIDNFLNLDTYNLYMNMHE